MTGAVRSRLPESTRYRCVSCVRSPDVGNQQWSGDVAGADEEGHRGPVLERHDRVALRAAGLLRRGASTGHRDGRLRRARPRCAASRCSSTPSRARRSWRCGRACGPSGSRRLATIGITEPRANSDSLFLTPEHRDHLRHHLPRPEGVGADGDRGAARVAVRRRRLLVPLRRRHGHRRTRPGRGRQVPLPARRATTATCPTGYFVYRSPTFTNWVVLRALGGVPAMKQTRIYPLAEADGAAATTSSSTSPTWSSTPCTPTTSRSSRRSTRSCRRSRPRRSTPSAPGSSRRSASSQGQPFAPDERLRGDPRARRADRRGHRPHRSPTRRATRTPSLYGSWQNAFVGGSHEFLRDGARLLDARTQFHYIATVITPAMAHAQVGAGSAYAYTVHDANGDLLDGARTYRLHVDPDPPAKNFWAVDVYDTQTRSLLQVPSTHLPALASNTGTLRANDDGSHDLYFGPERPRGQGVELGRDRARQVLVPDPPALRPARALVRPDLAAQRVRTARLTHSGRVWSVSRLARGRVEPRHRFDPRLGAGTAEGRL